METELAEFRSNISFPAVSTIAEIEAAIEKLTPDQAREIATWLEERQQLIRSSEGMFQMYDEEEQAWQRRSEGKSG